jgi:hypothetical protein
MKASEWSMETTAQFALAILGLFICVGLIVSIAGGIGEIQDILASVFGRSDTSRDHEIARQSTGALACGWTAIATGENSRLEECMQSLQLSGSGLSQVSQGATATAQTSNEATVTCETLPSEKITCECKEAYGEYRRHIVTITGKDRDTCLSECRLSLKQEYISDEYTERQATDYSNAYAVVENCQETKNIEYKCCGISTTGLHFYWVKDEDECTSSYNGKFVLDPGSSFCWTEDPNRVLNQETKTAGQVSCCEVEFPFIDYYWVETLEQCDGLKYHDSDSSDIQPDTACNYLGAKPRVSNIKSCTVKNFKLPENPMGLDLKAKVSGFGDPQFLVFWEKFPPGEDRAWQSTESWMPSIQTLMFGVMCVARPIKWIVKGVNALKQSLTLSEILNAEKVGAGTAAEATATKNTISVIVQKSGVWTATSGGTVIPGTIETIELGATSSSKALAEAIAKTEGQNILKKIAPNVAAKAAAYMGVDVGLSYVASVIDKQWGKFVEEHPSSLVLYEHLKGTNDNDLFQIDGAYLSKHNRLSPLGEIGVPGILSKTSETASPFYLASPCSADIKLEAPNDEEDNLVKCGTYAYSKLTKSTTCLSPKFTDNTIYKLREALLTHQTDSFVCGILPFDSELLKVFQEQNVDFDPAKSTFSNLPPDWYMAEGILMYAYWSQNKGFVLKTVNAGKYNEILSILRSAGHSTLSDTTIILYDPLTSAVASGVFTQPFGYTYFAYDPDGGESFLYATQKGISDVISCKIKNNKVDKRWFDLSGLDILGNDESGNPVVPKELFVCEYTIPKGWAPKGGIYKNARVYMLGTVKDGKLGEFYAMLVDPYAVIADILGGKDTVAGFRTRILMKDGDGDGNLDMVGNYWFGVDLANAALWSESTEINYAIFTDSDGNGDLDAVLSRNCFLPSAIKITVTKHKQEKGEYNYCYQPPGLSPALETGLVVAGFVLDAAGKAGASFVGGQVGKYATVVTEVLSMAVDCTLAYATYKTQVGGYWPGPAGK